MNKISNEFVIFTVYRPEENGVYLEEWMDYHRSIGVTHFYLYSNNGGSGNWGTQVFKIDKNLTKNGQKFKWPVDKASKLNKQICDNYKDVTLVEWSPKGKNGETLYGWNAAYIDFYKKMKNYKGKKGLAAIIDVDEYLVIRGELKPGRMKQVIFEDIQNYNSVYDCKKMANIPPIDIVSGTKVIMDLNNMYGLFREYNDDPTKPLKLGMHFVHLKDKIPFLDTVYYHYCWSEIRYKRYSEQYKINSNYKYVKHEGLIK